MGEQKKKKSGLNMGLILSGLMGGGIGILIARLALRPEIEALEPVEELLYFVLLFVLFYVANFLQIIIHEAGHLVCGLISGYKFFMFKIGSLTLVRDDGKLKLKKMSIPGMAGQCLMIPPGTLNSNYPVMLYNMGGVIANVITGAISAALWLLLSIDSLAGLFFLLMACVAFMMALLNGIPMRVGVADNDGRNALTLGKNPAEMRGLWIQLKASEQTALGVRLRDMPAEWFDMPSDEEMKNSMSAAVGVFVCNRMMDSYLFKEAYAEMERLLGMDTAIAELHRRLLIAECIYCELMGENRPEKLKELCDRRQMNFMKSMKNFISIARTDYAYALLHKKDSRKAEKYLARFEKAAAKHPYPGDVESELNLVRLAQKRAEEQ